MEPEQFPIPMDPFFSAASMHPIFSTTTQQSPYHHPPHPIPTHTLPPTPPAQHPPYEDMITKAIGALNESEGSSKQAISKFIDRVFKNLPPNHSELLTHHMKILKNSGQIVLIKRSYKLPHRSAPAPPPSSAPPPNVVTNGGAVASTVTSYSTSGHSVAQNFGTFQCDYQNYYDRSVGSDKNVVQASSPVSQTIGHALNGVLNNVVPNNVVPSAQGNGGLSGSDAMLVSLGLSDGASVEVTQTKKRRGRPPKSISATPIAGQGMSEPVAQSGLNEPSVVPPAPGAVPVQVSVEAPAPASSTGRPRGRPKRIEVEAAVPVPNEPSVLPPAPGVLPVQVPIEAPAPAPASGTGRPRGRPKRYAVEAAVPVPAPNSGHQQPKKRGRKPKNAEHVIHSAVPVTMVMPNPGIVSGAAVLPPQYTLGAPNGGESLSPVGDYGETQLPSGKRRGRPPGGGRLKKQRKVTRKWKPLGRPTKNPSSGDNSQSLAVQNLKSKLEYLRSRIRENISIIKPSINMETSTDAMGALQHLEGLAIAGF